MKDWLKKLTIPLRKIAKIIDVHYDTGKRYVRKFNLRPEGPSRKITDEEIIFLKNLGFTLSEIAEIKKMSYQSIYCRAKKLAKEGYIEVLPKSYVLGLKWSIKAQEKKRRSFEKLVNFLDSNGGTCSFKDISNVTSNSTLNRLIREHPEIFQPIAIK